MCQRWMIANGLPLAERHSTVLVVELNGPNQDCAAGSREAPRRLRPTETASRRSSSLISTMRPSLPGQTRMVESSTPLPALLTRQSFGAVEVYELPIVSAFDCRIMAAVTATSVSVVATIVTGEGMYRMVRLLRERVFD